MQKINTNSDNILQHRLTSLSIDDEEYWSFKGKSKREYCHGFFQYPAMMVPQLVRVLLSEICAVQPDLSKVGDPFAGSGTVLTESMLQGKNFWGVDINPLAILLCKVKRGPFYLTELKQKIDKLAKNISNKTNIKIDTAFNNINKWFRDDIKKSLIITRECIREEESLWARRFFWVALAETVRLTSNSRTSTFKLHTRTKEDINSRPNNVSTIFSLTVNRNYKLYCKQFEKLKYHNLLNNGEYINRVEINLDDTKKINEINKCDLMITSPPYGDNTSTVPYGQYSYLPLQWIDLKDISKELFYNPIANTHSIDSASLGGSKIVTDSEIRVISALSKSFARYSESIKSEPKDRLHRVASFIKDINHSLPGILNSLNSNGIMIFVLGNRKVGGHSVPFDSILIELLEELGTKHICTINRTIPTKRMASKNSLADTMSRERIVVTRKIG